MRTFALGEVLASRTVKYQSPLCPSGELTVQIGQPVPDGEGAWVCPFQIGGVPDEPVRGIFGVDAFQALILALHIIPTELQAAAREQAEVCAALAEADDHPRGAAHYHVDPALNSAEDGSVPMEILSKPDL